MILKRILNTYCTYTLYFLGYSGGSIKKGVRGFPLVNESGLERALNKKGTEKLVSYNISNLERLLTIVLALLYIEALTVCATLVIHARIDFLSIALQQQNVPFHDPSLRD